MVIDNPGRLQAVIRRRMTTDNDRQQPQTTRSNGMQPQRRRSAHRLTKTTTCERNRAETCENVIPAISGQS